MSFWNKTKDLPTEPIKYIPGTVAKTETGWWYIGEKVRMEVPTKRVFKSWEFPLVVETTEAALARYPKVGKLGFRPGSFLCDISSGVYYIVGKDKLHMVQDPDTLGIHHLYPADAIAVSKEEIDLHKEDA